MPDTASTDRITEPLTGAPPDAPAGLAPDLQPWLHDLVAVLQAPTQVWSAASGQISGEGAVGYVHADVRVLRRAVLLVGGEQPIPLAHHLGAAGEAVFTASARGLGSSTPDPAVRIVRRRLVTPGTISESVEIRSWAATDVAVDVALEVCADLAALDAIKGDRFAVDVAPQRTPGGLLWSDGATTAVLEAPGSDVALAGTSATLRWHVEVPRGSLATVGWTVRAEQVAPVLAAAEGDPQVPLVGVTGEDRRWPLVLDRALADLAGLQMSLTGRADQDFLAAGAPWFLTLFGRDSLWAARMLLPVTTSLAGSTLRALAHFQGRTHDALTGEAPGKILHEVRGSGFALPTRPGESVAHTLPPVYYGAIDTTPLWILTLHDAWRWGLAEEQVSALLEPLEAAVAWLTTQGDGFLAYIDESGAGLSNQGWKDSGDAVRHADGSTAVAPIALCEVQAYAYAAAQAAADVLDAFGRPGGEDCRAWAQRLRVAFRAAFWVQDEAGPYPALALDATQRPVASLTSNIGHLLGTGLLDDEEGDLVAARLAGPEMFSGFGIRTLSADAAGYSPMGYHIGTVWPHDTAIAVSGMAATGSGATAAVASGLLDAMVAFGGRVPELFCGDARDEQPVPVPYPAACRPQAWSAAAAVSLLVSVLGLRVTPAGLSASPVQPWPFGEMTVRGLRVADQRYEVEVDRGGIAWVTTAG